MKNEVNPNLLEGREMFNREDEVEDEEETEDKARDRVSISSDRSS